MKTTATPDRDALFNDNVKLVPHVLNRVVLPGWADPDDAHQEGLLGLLSAAKNFDPSRGLKFSTYAGECILNAIRSYFRNGRRRLLATPTVRLDGEAAIDPPDHRPGPEDAAVMAELSGEVRAAVDALPEERREAVRHYLGGGSTGTLAEEEGVTRQAVRDRLKRACRLLARAKPELAVYVGGEVARAAVRAEGKSVPMGTLEVVHHLEATPMGVKPECERQARELTRPTPTDYSAWPELLDARRVADAMSFGVRTLWRLVAAGQFPQPVRLSRKLVRWPKARVVAWLEAQAAG